MRQGPGHDSSLAHACIAPNHSGGYCSENRQKNSGLCNHSTDRFYFASGERACKRNVRLVSGEGCENHNILSFFLFCPLPIEKIYGILYVIGNFSAFFGKERSMAHPSLEKKNISAAELLLLVLKGIIAGAAGILPGFSGGVMMLVFGIYEPLMYLFTHPIDGLKKFWKRLLPFVIGIGIGFILTSAVLSKVFEIYEAEATCLFVGLILGMIPSLFREAGEKGRNAGSYVAIAVAAVLAFLLFSMLRGDGADVQLTFGWAVLCGVLCALSVIVPGMSFSAPMMMLGLYDPFNGAVKSLISTDPKWAPQIGPLFACALGGLAAILLLSRLVTFIFGRFYNPARHAIIGIILASALPPLWQTEYRGAGHILFCIALLLFGVFLALTADRFETKAKQTAEQTEKQS